MGYFVYQFHHPGDVHRCRVVLADGYDFKYAPICLHGCGRLFRWEVKQDPYQRLLMCWSVQAQAWELPTSMEQFYENPESITATPRTIFADIGNFTDVL